jgi:HSP20 family molecular chaperone IbpA
MMSKVALQKFRDMEEVPRSLFAEMAALTEAIRQKAFTLFQSRHGENGSDLDDWLRAERELVWTPMSELVEGSDEIRARIALPGFDPAEIDVKATPDALVEKAETAHTHRSDEGNVRFCEFSAKKVFRRIAMPAPIDVDKIAASLDKGILQVTAAKAAQPKAQAGSAAA